MKKNYTPFSVYTVKDEVATHVGEAAIEHFKELGITGRICIFCIFPIQIIAEMMNRKTPFENELVYLPFGDKDRAPFAQDPVTWFEQCFANRGYFKSGFDHFVFVGHESNTVPFIKAFAPMNKKVAGQLAEMQELIPGSVVTVERRRTESNHRPTELSFGTFYTYPTKEQKAA